MVLDGLLSRKAAENASDDQIDRVVANRERMEQAVADHDLLKYSALIQEHHALVREMASHPIAAALEERLQAQIVRHQFQLSLRPGRADESLAELKQVIDAIVDRDPDRAEEAARAQFQGVIAALLRESGGE